MKLIREMLRSFSSYTDIQPIVKAPMPPIRFVIIGVARSGSTMLSSLLNSHSQTIVFGELFRDEDAIGWDLPRMDAGAPSALAIYRTNPVRFLEEQVFDGHPAETRAVGFKLFYYHARSAPFTQIWDWLRGDPTIRVIHIKRSNALAQYFSLQRAEQTGAWVSLQGKGVKQSAAGEAAPEPGPLRLDPADCARHFAWLRQQEEETDAFFADHPILHVTYEDLVADLASESARVQSFLRLPEEQLSVVTRRQSAAPLPEVIANFRELRKEFIGTPYYSYFESAAQAGAVGEK